jgi:hypothetical protein
MRCWVAHSEGEERGRGRPLTLVLGPGLHGSDGPQFLVLC